MARPRGARNKLKIAVPKAPAPENPFTQFGQAMGLGAVEQRADAAINAATAKAASEIVSPPEPVQTRPDMRQPIREEDPRARAARRAAELHDHGSLGDGGTDEFYIDPADVPPGWSYEWKTKTVLGAENPAYEVAVARAGWEPVPASRHPSFMPAGRASGAIERKGMILMERPLVITEEARNRDLQEARRQVRDKEQQLGAAPQGQFERDNKGTPLASVKKSYEPIPIPQE